MIIFKSISVNLNSEHLGGDNDVEIDNMVMYFKFSCSIIFFCRTYRTAFLQVLESRIKKQIQNAIEYLNEHALNITMNNIKFPDIDKTKKKNSVKKSIPHKVIVGNNFYWQIRGTHCAVLLIVRRLTFLTFSDQDSSEKQAPQQQTYDSVILADIFNRKTCSGILFENGKMFVFFKFFLISTRII